MAKNANRISSKKTKKKAGGPLVEKQANVTVPSVPVSEFSVTSAKHAEKKKN